jgi:hypothetical protein
MIINTIYTMNTYGNNASWKTGKHIDIISVWFTSMTESQYDVS